MVSDDKGSATAVPSEMASYRILGTIVDYDGGIVIVWPSNRLGRPEAGAQVVLLSRWIGMEGRWRRG
jgi:hypothetical protein